MWTWNRRSAGPARGTRLKLARSVNPSTLEIGRIGRPHVAGCFADRKVRALTL